MKHEYSRDPTIETIYIHLFIFVFALKCILLVELNAGGQAAIDMSEIRVHKIYVLLYFTRYFIIAKGHILK